MKFSTFCASVVLIIPLLISANALAHPTLLTISETENGNITTWWPAQFSASSLWENAFEAQGIVLIHPASIQPPPRLSPAVYAPKSLTQANARTLSQLLGADSALNGNVTWSCSPKETDTECTATATLSLLYGKSNAIDLNASFSAVASDPSAAKQMIVSRFATEFAWTIINHSKKTDDIPKLSQKPVIIFDSLPNADSLVALRKALKKVPGVEDVAEIWVADGALAIEINPASETMPQSDFLQIVQGFTTQTVENLIIRPIRKTDDAAVFEIVQY